MSADPSSTAVQQTLLVDAHLAREGSPEGESVRPCTDVAVGILVQPDGRFLLTTRPPGKSMRGTGSFRAVSWKREKPWREPWRAN